MYVHCSDLYVHVYTSTYVFQLIYTCTYGGTGYSLSGRAPAFPTGLGAGAGAAGASPPLPAPAAPALASRPGGPLRRHLR